MTCEQSYRETAACVSELTGQIVSVSDIKKAYDKALGRETNSSQIYKVLHRHGWRIVMPRSRHPKTASDEVVNASKN